jgi:hypothetical protein
MNTQMMRQGSAASFAAKLTIVTLFAVALSACAADNTPLPRISEASLASGATLPQGVLPNGLVTEPYAD